MKRSFTLIELIVSVVIVMLISGGALVYFNEFNSRQKLEKAKDEIVASIKLVQSYAKGRQLPINATQSELKFVYLTLIGGSDGLNNSYLKGCAFGEDNNWYFRTLVKKDGIIVSMYPPIIYFWAGTGRLADAGGVFYGVGDTAKVTVTHSAEIDERYEIIINALGQIKEVNYYEE